jgi:hypothetical protein
VPGMGIDQLIERYRPEAMKPTEAEPQGADREESAGRSGRRTFDRSNIMEYEHVLRPGTCGELAGNSEAQISSKTYEVERGGTRGRSMLLPGEISELRGEEKSAEAVVALKRGNACGAKGRSSEGG